MITAAFVLVLAGAAAWVLRSVRSEKPAPDRALQVAWQLAALSFLSAPETLIEERGEVIVQVVLGAMAVLAIVVRLAMLAGPGPTDGSTGRGGRWRGAFGQNVVVTPWLVAYAAVLAAAAALSSAPDIAALRGVRAIALFAVFGQAANGLDRAVLRRLFGQFTTGAAAVVVAGAVIDPDLAFRPLRAPVIRYALQAPLLGSGPHIVATIGFGLLVAVAWRWLDGDRPPPGSRRWMLTIALPAVLGLTLVVGSQKRAFWLALVVAAVVWLALRHRRLLIPSLVGIGLAAASFLAIGPLRDLWDRERSRPQIDNIASVRSAIFEASLDRFAQRPLIGDGLGVGNRDLLIDVGQVGLEWSSHSEVGAALAASGLVGLAIIVWGHLRGLAGARSAWRSPNDPLPLIVTLASLALLPFWRVLQEPLLIGLPYYTIVFPLHDWRPLASLGRPTWMAR